MVWVDIPSSLNCFTFTAIAIRDRRNARLSFKGKGKMTALRLASTMIVLLMAAAASAHAQTGKELLGVCTSKDPIQQRSCTDYISGFIRGLKAAEHLRGEICIPKDLTGNEAKSIFVDTMAYIELAAVLNKGTGPDPNTFFSKSRDAALAASLEMKFRCPPTGQLKTRLGK